MMKNPKLKKELRRTSRAHYTYFLTTISTENGNEYFGRMKNGKMVSSKTGEIVKEAWESLPTLNEKIKLDNYVIMPNHLHGIIYLSGSNGARSVLKALESSINAIEGFRKTVKDMVHTSNPRTKFNWAKDFNIYTIKDEGELYDMRYYIEKEALKWEYDSENTKNKLYITSRKKK
jgi:REP element-mobilizing transposase RayT